LPNWANWKRRNRFYNWRKKRKKFSLLKVSKKRREKRVSFFEIPFPSLSLPQIKLKRGRKKVWD
jgi:hypothetical protein